VRLQPDHVLAQPNHFFRVQRAAQEAERSLIALRPVRLALRPSIEASRAMVLTWTGMVTELAASGKLHYDADNICRCRCRYSHRPIIRLHACSRLGW
jgi:hypothetical protein